jgi:hypothetical protein
MWINQINNIIDREEREELRDEIKRLTDNAEFYRKMASDKMSHAAELNFALVIAEAEVARLTKIVEEQKAEIARLYIELDDPHQS